MASLRFTLWIVAAVMVAACSSKKNVDWAGMQSSGEGGATSAPHVRIVAPKSGDTLAGAAEMKVDLVLPDKVARVELGVDGRWIALAGASSRIPFDTTGAENGTLTLGFRITADDGSVYEDSVEVEVDNPEHRLQQSELGSSMYSNGDTVTIDLTYSEPGLELTVDGSDVDTDFDADAVDVEDRGKGAYRVSYPISAKNEQEDGKHGFIVRAENGDGETVENYVEIEFRKRPNIPFTVAGGAFRDRGEPPVVLVSEGAPKLVSVEANPTLVTGGTVDMKLEWEEDADNPARAIIVASKDNSGYWTVPVSSTDGKQTLELGLYFLSPPMDGMTNNLRVAVVDNAGRSIEWRGQPITELIVGSGGVQVSLIWDKSMDLDLHVTDPNGKVADFASIGKGDGLLDLDSNAECKLDNKNTENVYWAEGKEVPGPYKIYVSAYAACGQSRAHFKVAAQVCGRAQTFEGDFTAADAKDHPNSLGRKVGRVMMNCPQKVSGKVDFERRNAAVPRLMIREAKTSPHAAAFVPVKAVRSVDKTCLARTMTDKDGKYTLRFQNTGDPKFTVQAEARSGKLKTATEENPCPDFETQASVMPLNEDTVYTYISAEQDGSAKPIITDLNLTVPIDKNAGAFNINDVVAHAYNWVRTQPINEELPVAKTRWTRGQPTAMNASYFANATSTLYIDATEKNADEWDDPVIGHEIGHFIVNRLSKDDSPGGPHQLQSDPPFAWSEGLATAIAADILGSSVTGNSINDSGTVYYGVYRDLEGDTQIKAGTDGGDMDDDLDEFLVASILYDLLDPKNEPHDQLEPSPYHFIGSAFGYVKKGKDRGERGIDLVDFLDGWRCQDQKSVDMGQQQSYEPALRSLLQAPSVKFPYDFKALSCPSPDSPD